MFKRRFTTALIIILGAAAFFYFYNKYRIAPDVKVLNLPLQNLDGSKTDLNQFKGKAVFINYWATWCGECLQEMPSIESAMMQSDTNKVVFLMVTDESSEKIHRYLAEHPYPMKFVRLEKRMQEIGIHTFPTTYLYDKTGTEVFSKVGSAKWDDEAMLTIIRLAVEK